MLDSYLDSIFCNNVVLNTDIRVQEYSILSYFSYDNLKPSVTDLSFIMSETLPKSVISELAIPENFNPLNKLLSDIDIFDKNIEIEDAIIDDNSSFICDDTLLYTDYNDFVN